ncbi:MAG: ComF family protein [Proteobacteria bacterium]|nr:ComF family protein [Pseudomonadota bacterium]
MVDIRLLFNQFHLDRFWPIPCALCGTTLDDSESQQSSPLCSHCWKRLPWLGAHCQRCALPMPDSDELVCGQCQQQPPPWGRTFALFQYREPMRSLIQQCKYQQQLHTSVSLGRLWSRELRHYLDLNEADAIVPIPLHWRRRWQRGFNQVTELLRPMAKEYKLNLQPGWLRRQRYADSQTRMNKKARIRNLRHAFRGNAEKVRDKHILLIDDVMTTGATARAASQCLLDAGARKVDIIVLARTDRS